MCAGITTRCNRNKPGHPGLSHTHAPDSLLNAADITLRISIASTVTIAITMGIMGIMGYVGSRGHGRLIDRDTCKKVLKIKAIALSVSIGCIIIALIITLCARSAPLIKFSKQETSDRVAYLENEITARVNDAPQGHI